MSTTALPGRLAGIPVEVLRQKVMEAKAFRRFESTIKQRGVLDRLWFIAEHGASPDDMDWLEQQSKDTGFDFHAAVAACVKFNEEY